MDDAVQPLPPVDDSFTSALAIVAHPDDLEYGAAAAIARWTAGGARVAYWLATRGEAGIDGMTPERAGPLREHEQRDSAAVVGVNTVEFGDYPDGMITYGLELRRDIARAIRRHRPDVVITANYHDTFGPGRFNQADHVAVGRAVIDGVRDADNRWVFRELADEEGLEKWHTSRILVGGSPAATHGVDVTDHFDAGVASLEAHAEYLAGLGADHPMADAREFLGMIARATGERLGVDKAVAFEVIDL